MKKIYFRTNLTNVKFANEKKSKRIFFKPENCFDSSWRRLVVYSAYQVNVTYTQVARWFYERNATNSRTAQKSHKASHKHATSRYVIYECNPFRESPPYLVTFAN